MPGELPFCLYSSLVHSGHEVGFLLRRRYSTPEGIHLKKCALKSKGDTVLRPQAVPGVCTNGVKVDAVKPTRMQSSFNCNAGIVLLGEINPRHRNSTHRMPWVFRRRRKLRAGVVEGGKFGKVDFCREHWK